jgi:addiction module HigA family antidote
MLNGTTNMTKIKPIHPGEILAEDFMAPRSLSALALATALHVPANRISEIIRGRRAITGDTALRLGRYFDTSPDLWMGLQAEYELRTARDAAGKQIEREVQVAGAL